MADGADAEQSHASLTFVDEGDGCVLCQPGQAVVEKAVYAEFCERFGSVVSDSEFTDSAKLLFKITIDNKEPSKKAKPIVYVGVPHSAPFSSALALCNRMFCKDAADEKQQGAFLLDGGFGVNPNKSSGAVFMSYGNELVFHTKVDFSRLAFAR